MKNAQYDVIVAGHICFDVIPRLLGSGEDFFRAFKPGKLIDIGEPTVSTGGPVSNTGIGLLKLGVRTGLMGKVGTDFFGRAILDRLREIGLEKSMTVVEGEHTSYTLAITPPGIDRIFLHSRGTNNTFGFDDVNFDVVADSKVFHFGYPPLMKRIYEHSAAELTRIFRKAKEVGATTSLDMALPDPSSPAGKEDWDEALRNTLPYVDLYLPSGEETLFMLDRPTFARRREEAGQKDVLDFLRIEDLQAVAEKVLAYGAKMVVLKCGHVGTSLLIQRFLMGFFWSSIFEMGRNIRSGHFDFFLAQPGNVMFMATTRKIDPDSMINSLVALSVVIYAARQLGLDPSATDLALYALLVVCGVIIHYSMLVLCITPAFWITSAQGIEGSYFTLSEFSRLPRQAFRGAANIAFVWILPVVIVSNAPASILLHGFDAGIVGWVLAITVLWFGLAVFVFQRGLRRYSSASS